MTKDPRSDFDALVTTVSSIYDLRGIGVASVSVVPEIWDWMVEQSRKKPFGESWDSASQTFTYSDVIVRELGNNEDGSIRRTISIKPYGSDRIPVKIKHGGVKPWRISVEYREV